jgi:hypothetical protein
MIDNLPILIKNGLKQYFDGEGYGFSNKKNLSYGEMRIIDESLSNAEGRERHLLVQQSYTPLKINFLPTIISIEVDNKKFEYEYDSLRIFTQVAGTNFAQLWFKNPKDKYSDFIYDIELSPELELLIKGICVFGKHFISIDKFNAWERMSFEDTYK